jgi:UDP-N-acetylmuramyl pentapeptide phosphotransferase/UDP-N-acetylglucosamine-1-phosphate transferase
VIDWTLVVNLLFLLLLLLTARQQWFARASDTQIQRRGARVQLVIGIAIFAGFVLLRATFARLFQHPSFVMFWFAFIAISVMPAEWRDSLRRVMHR